MKTAVLFCIISTLLCSCGTYNYLTISHAGMEASDKKFTAADSSLKISYSFAPNSSILELRIENNSRGPVTVDWRKSSIITNGKAVSLYNGSVPFNATASKDQYVQPHVTNISGNASLPEGTDFIPPASVISKSTIAAISNTYNFPFAVNDQIIKTGSMNQQKKFPGKLYSSGESPYKIRVYLTYLENGGREKVIENEFYVSEIINTARGPEAMQEFFTGNKPYICSFVLNQPDYQPYQY